MKLFLCGDVMTGRGIDQIMPHSVNPVLYESFVKDAREYVYLAERVSGPISKPVDSAYIWGDALDELERVGADLRIINLETSITTSEDYWRNKPVLYRMHPLNVECLTAARIDCCCLANNHVLDWGYQGLKETLAALDQAGLKQSGAGENARQAAEPAIFSVQGSGRVLVYAFGSPTSGVPLTWGATPSRPGVCLLSDLSENTARQIAKRMLALRQPGDIIIASIHWGSNWGYEVSEEQIHFAHVLIDEGVSIIHGHSSHHVRPMEVYRGKLILYGCGDFLTDYEGISGYEKFRGDLALAYFVTVDAEHDRLIDVRLVPMQQRRFCLRYASPADVHWLGNRLNILGAPYHTRLQLKPDNSLSLVWAG